MGCAGSSGGGGGTERWRLGNCRHRECRLGGGRKVCGMRGGRGESWNDTNSENRDSREGKGGGRDLEGVASARIDGRGGGLFGNVRWMRSGERELGRDLGWGRRGNRGKGAGQKIREGELREGGRIVRAEWRWEQDDGGGGGVGVVVAQQT